MVDVVGHRFLGETQDDVENSTVTITGVEEILHLAIGDITTTTQHAQRKRPKCLKFGRGQGGAPRNAF